MGFIRTLMLLVACVLPWQSVQADLSALMADAPMTMDADMPCDQPGCDCCDESCQQMVFCPVFGALYLPAGSALVPVDSGTADLRPSMPATPVRVDLALPFRPPIPFVI